MRIREDRVDERLQGIANSRRIKWFFSFTQIPTIVAAADDDIHFLKTILSDVAHPQRAGLPVETDAPGGAQARRPDFAACLRSLPDKRIIPGDCVILA